MSLSLVRYIFLLLPLCTFTCSGVRGSLVVIVCPFFSIFFFFRILPFYRSFAFPYTYSIMRTSSGPSCPFGLRIGGSYTEGLDLGQIGGGSGRPAIIVNRVPSAGPSSPRGQGKGKVSEIRYPSGSAYLRAAVQNAEAVGPCRVEPFLDIISPLAIGQPLVFGFGTLTFSLFTSFKCRRWFSSSRWPLRMVFASLCIPLSKASCSILMSVRSNFLPTFGVSWSGC